jgi:hypothetical protein
VSITELRQEIATRLRDPSVLLRIRDQIGRTYSLILGRYLSVYLNEELVEPIAVPIGSSDALDRAVQHLSLDNGTVKATVVAGVADRDHQNQQDAGWYVLCNGRAIVWADKTTMTGWGDGVPQFVPSFRSFVGVVLFFSAHPALLPWQTTKRGLNQDSLVYLQARPVMRAIARPVLDYLRTLYYDSGEEMVKERQQLDNVKPVQMSSLGEAPARTFQATAAARVKKSDVVSVQFDATRDEIARAGRILGEPGESARRIARAALDFVLDEPGE